MKKNWFPDWKSRLKKDGDGLNLDLNGGRYCYIVHPTECGKDKTWWE